MTPALRYQVIPEGYIGEKLIPVSVVFVNTKEILQAGLSQEEAIHALAGQFSGPTAINLFDMDAVTTTSDGILAEGAIVKMAASDYGRVNPDFGILPMQEMPYSEELVEREPHLIQWKTLFPQKKLFRGPNPATSLIPVHNVVISGRAANNNSATEMMNIVTMEELIFPILGQLTCVRGGSVLIGNTGETISVGIGMTVAEQYGRVFPRAQFHAGETAHNSGAHAKTLKEKIPCIVCSKVTLAEHIIRAISCGCVPGRHIGCSPAVLAVAKALGSEIDFSRITSRAQEELDSVGCTREWMRASSHLTKEAVIAHADEIIPGVENGAAYETSAFVQARTLSISPA